MSESKTWATCSGRHAARIPGSARAHCSRGETGKSLPRRRNLPAFLCRAVTRSGGARNALAFNAGGGRAAHCAASSTRSWYLCCRRGGRVVSRRTGGTERGSPERCCPFSSGDDPGSLAQAHRPPAVASAYFRLVRTFSLMRWMWPRPMPFTSQPSSKKRSMRRSSRMQKQSTTANRPPTLRNTESGSSSR